MTTPSHDTRNKQPHSPQSVSLDELMIQQTPIEVLSQEIDHYSLNLNSQHTIESALTMLDIASTPAGKRRSALPRTKSLEAGKMKKEREAKADKAERCESKKKRRSSTNPERKKSSSRRHEGTKENNKSKSSSAAVLCAGEQCTADATSGEPPKAGDLQTRKKKSSLKKSIKVNSDHSKEHSSSSSSRERKSGRRRRSNSLPKQSPTTARVQAPPPTSSLPFIPSLEEAQTKSERLKGMRSQSFRIPRRAVGIEFSTNNLSPIASVGSREEDSCKATTRRPRSSSVESNDIALNRSMLTRHGSGTKPVNRTPTRSISESVSTERISNLSSPDLDFLKFKRARELISQRSKSFRHSRVDRGLERTVSSPNLSPATDLSIGTRGQALVKAMRRNLEDFTINHAPSEAEEMISILRQTLDDVAAKHESSKRTRSTRTRTTPPVRVRSLKSTSTVLTTVLTPESRDVTPPRISRQSSVRISRPKAPKTDKRKSRRRSLNDNVVEDKEKNERSKHEEKMKRLGTNIDSLFQKWEALQQHQHLSKESKKQRQQRQSRTRRNSIASPVA